MANIRRGLERIGKVLKVWGILISIIIAALVVIQGMDPTEWTTEDEVVESIQFASFYLVFLGWAPFLLFKFLFWIGSGFVDEEGKSETETQ